ncbi:glycosyltransferase family 2 protein [Sphingomonas crocodyli]|uniref:Glycosyltransferase n=1 Tax=Sphingomonas crocodyli TaxID=1979270 RepID=A0A437M769_9SPHN|nr:glycosyltransferase family 2 protein [Sphingomonas crocodyli]RVT93570.1 glycosyltransferase [Sphingomonas crocodyli]
MMNVCAVVLTYNRKDLLAECLDAIQQQSVACGSIIVLDNGSSDGTVDMLRSSGDRIEIHALPSNIGAAGGFNAAMRAGYESGADFIWVMDDDVIAAPDALEKLLDARAMLAGKAIHPPFLISTARAPGGEITNTPALDTRLNPLDYESWPDLLAHGLMPVRRATFVSILLPRETLREHGLPIPQFYIWGEDTEFTTRITRDRPGYMVGDSRVVHVRQMSGSLDIRTETNPRRIGYHFYAIRNNMWMVLQAGKRRAIVKLVKRRAVLALQLCREKQFYKAKMVAKGVLSAFFFKPVPDMVDRPNATGASRAETLPSSISNDPLGFSSAA